VLRIAQGLLPGRALTGLVQRGARLVVAGLGIAGLG